jgi:hypothetical protein
MTFRGRLLIPLQLPLPLPCPLAIREQALDAIDHRTEAAPPMGSQDCYAAAATISSRPNYASARASKLEGARLKPRHTARMETNSPTAQKVTIVPKESGSVLVAGILVNRLFAIAVMANSMYDTDDMLPSSHFRIVSWPR